MGKFIVHGIIIEQPTKITLSSGLDCVTVLIEEKVRTSFKEVVNVYSVDFVGKATTCVPTSLSLVGATAIAMGSISSREYHGKYYNDLKGDSLTIVTTKSFEESTPTQAEVNENREIRNNIDDLPDDDLPF